MPSVDETDAAYGRWEMLEVDAIDLGKDAVRAGGVVHRWMGRDSNFVDSISGSLS